MQGHRLCFQGWKMLLNVSNYMISKALRAFKIGLVSIDQSYVEKMSKGRISIKRNITRAWLQNYFKSYGEVMPHKNEIHLPSFLTKKRLYQVMCEDMKEKSNNEFLSKTAFQRLWKDEFKHVVIPPVINVILSFIYLFCS